MEVWLGMSGFMVRGFISGWITTEEIICLRILGIGLVNIFFHDLVHHQHICLVICKLGRSHCTSANNSTGYLCICQRESFAKHPTPGWPKQGFWWTKIFVGKNALHAIGFSCQNHPQNIYISAICSVRMSEWHQKELVPGSPVWSDRCMSEGHDSHW